MRKPTKYLCTGRAEYAGGSKVKDIWPCGHYRVREIRTPIGPLHPDGVRQLVKMWAGGPLYLPACPTCGFTNMGGRRQ